MCNDQHFFSSFPWNLNSTAPSSPSLCVLIFPTKENSFPDEAFTFHQYHSFFPLRFSLRFFFSVFFSLSFDLFVFLTFKFRIKKNKYLIIEKAKSFRKLCNECQQILDFGCNFSFKMKITVACVGNHEAKVKNNVHTHTHTCTVWIDSPEIAKDLWWVEVQLLLEN